MARLATLASLVTLWLTLDDLVMKLIIIFFCLINVARADGSLVISKSITLNLDKKKVWSLLTTKKGLESWWGKGVCLESKLHGDFYEPWGKGQVATGKITKIDPMEMI